MLAAMKTSTSALSLLCLTLLGACGNPLDIPDKIRDSTGLEFGWDCSESTLCDLSSAPAISSSCDLPVWGRSWGRFYSLCSACGLPSGGWASVDFQCRPVACDSDGDCPQIAARASDSDAIREDIYECVEGLCQNADTARHPRDALRSSDASLLCYANVGREETRFFASPAVLLREPALMEACPISADTCVLPAVCDAP